MVGLVLAGGVTARRAAKSSPLACSAPRQQASRRPGCSCLKSWHPKACLSNDFQTSRSRLRAIRRVQLQLDTSRSIKWHQVKDSQSWWLRILYSLSSAFSSVLQFQSPLVRHLPLSQPAILPAVRRTPRFPDIGLPPGIQYLTSISVQLGLPSSNQTQRATCFVILKNVPFKVGIERPYLSIFF